tara:strand:- start:325 stop:519 length:195 start_codon:yes stop_codon:yes gene_type:complete
MYATEKYVRIEIKEVHASMRELANDLGGDLRFLSQEIHDLSERMQLLETQIEELREEWNQKNGA